MPPDYAFRPSADQKAGRAVHHPVIVVGAGPVGLALAVDLKLRGITPLVLEARTAASVGSRAICYAKRSLEILARLGVGQRMLDKGVTWQQGKVFWRDRMVYQFDLLPEAGHRMPAFVNCQQYYLEEFLAERAAELGVDLRFGHRLAGVTPRDDGVRLEVATPAGSYELSCDWLFACDGARSTVRHALGLAFEGQVFKDQFLITDVRMDAHYPPERWFWFDPPFHPGQSALLHSQPDKVWRIDLQLGWDADAEEEIKPARVTRRLQAMLGTERRFELEWISIYTFRCRRLTTSRQRRLYFLIDPEHEDSPFGEVGFSSGKQDAVHLERKIAREGKCVALAALRET
jgi:3-(3-hydroxy-phenyl)propionate hydroxylase